MESSGGEDMSSAAAFLSQEPQRPVVVTTHAVEQYRRRRPGALNWDAATEEIRQGVESALRNGRILNHKPDGFLLYGEKRRQLPGEERFVFNEDATIGWVIKQRDDADVVITTLTRSGYSRRIPR